MHIVKLKYDGTVTPKATSFLKAEPIDMAYTADYEVDDSDFRLADALRKQFAKEMAECIRSQAEFLDEWLGKMNEPIAKVVKGIEQIKGSLPTDPSQARACEQQLLALKDAADKVEEARKEYLPMVQDWARNCRDQQAKVAIVKALKAVRMQEYRKERLKVTAKAAALVVVTVVGAAGAAVAVAMSAGTLAAAVVPFALTAEAFKDVGIGLKLGQALAEGVTAEQKILNDVRKDTQTALEAIRNVRDKAGPIGEHAAKLGTFIKVREGKLNELQQKISRCRGRLQGHDRELKALKDPASGKLLDRNRAIAEMTAWDDARGELVVLESRLAELREDLSEAKEVLAKLEALSSDLKRVAGATPDAVLSGIDATMRQTEKWTKVAVEATGLGAKIAKAVLQ